MEMRSQPVARVVRKGSMPRSLFDSGELGLTCHGVRIGLWLYYIYLLWLYIYIYI